MSTQKKLVLNSWVVPLLANIFTTPKYPPRHFYRRWQIFYLNEDSRCVLSKCTVGKLGKFRTWKHFFSIWIFGAKIQIFNRFHCYFWNIRILGQKLGYCPSVDLYNTIFAYCGLMWNSDGVSRHFSLLFGLFPMMILHSWKTDAVDAHFFALNALMPKRP